jgi:hypothetical protein
MHVFRKRRVLLPLLLLCALLPLLPAREQMARFRQPVPSPSEPGSRFKRNRTIDTEPASITQTSTSPIESNSQEKGRRPTGFPLSLSQASINFGPELVGATSAPQLETLANSGESALTIIELEISGGDRADFSLAYGFILPVTLMPGGSVTANLNFTPSAPWKPGSRDARLKIKWSGGNQIVALTGMGVTCAGAVPAAESGGVCADTDGDGFNDVWEENDYIDLNNNGREDDEDFHFPHRRSHIFSAVALNGSGAGRVFPTVTDPKLRIGASTVVVTVASGGPVGTATFTYSVDGGHAVGPQSTRPVEDLPGNLRLMFYDLGDSPFVTGNTYTFTTSMGQRTKLADKNAPNIYVQYDYMGFSSPGAACSLDDDCNAGGNQLNATCHKGFCNHNHAPGDPLFRKVVDQFAAHGITLYIDPSHEAVPHAQVITWSRPGDGTTGATAACAGGDVVSGNIGPGQFAVNFHDIKYRPGSDFAAQPVRKNIYHYTVFSHFNTCVSSLPGAPGYCGACNGVIDRGPLPSLGFSPGATGLAELPGNDFMVSLGENLNHPSVSTPLDPFYEGGLFMHELGHNIGLHHHGDVSTPASSPNYLSVMNYNYNFGIPHAATTGSIEVDEDLRELNYSEHALNNLNELALDESAGLSPISSGYTGIIGYFTNVGGFKFAPEAGPIDWNGNGLIDAGFVVDDVDLIGGAVEILNGYADWVHGPCASSTDCRINGIRESYRQTTDPTFDPHEPCVQGRCQSLWFPFQATRWGKAD